MSNFRISGIKRNYHNSRTSEDIDMKLGPLLNLIRETKQRQKELTMTSCWEIVTSLPFFQFTANLEQCGTGFRTHSL